MGRTDRMHRIVRIDADHSAVRTIFHEVGSWPQWMPGIQACQVLESTAGRARVKVDQSVLGRIWTQTLDIELGDDRVRIRALDGLLRWRIDWCFRSPPDGLGTTLWMELEMKAGVIGLASGRLFQKINERRFGETVEALRLRARQSEVRETRPAEGRSVLTVYETTDGFEVWYAGRKYVTRKSPS